jgi:DNA-directed RNA polymerase specialized sigma24 family protein
MSAPGSVTHLISRVQAGDAVAMTLLVNRYLTLLTRALRGKPHGWALGAQNCEDVALHALDSFLRGAGRGRYTRLHDRNDLWHLLTKITLHKAISQIKYRNRQCRKPPDNNAPVEQVGDPRPPPDLMVLANEEVRRLLDLLKDATLRSIAVWKWDGYTSQEIAAMLGCAERTVERKLNLIRKIWAPEIRP